MPSRPNLVVVSVDCMRRDRVSAYGYERRTTPFLDSMLDRSLHCTSAHAASCWTCPSVLSLLSGLYPHRHGGGIVPGEAKNLSKHNLPTRLRDDVPILPDLLGARGYDTAAIGAVWNAHLPLPGRFQHMEMIEKGARRVVRSALSWIHGRSRPFFLWLHLGDPHEPLNVPRSRWNEFGPVPRRLRNVRRWDYTKADAPVPSPAFERYREARVRLYDAAVRSADEQIEVLWRSLAADGAMDRTVFVVTSDHGEEFWEHRDEEMRGFEDPRDIYGTGHGHNVFQVHLLVPLVLTGPGIDPAAVDTNVSLVDVAPTVARLLDVELGDVDGRSLLDRSPVDEERPVLAEAVAYGHEKRSVVVGDLKLLSAPGDGYERAFRLGTDRREAAPVDDPTAAARLRAFLPHEPTEMGEQVEGTDEIVEHLRDLGYIE